MAFVDYIQTTSVRGRQQFGHTESDDQRADVAGQYYKQQQQKNTYDNSWLPIGIVIIIISLYFYYSYHICYYE